MQEALIVAIKNYIEGKKEDQFSYNIIKLLSYIYSEADIINPYKLGDFRLLDTNLKKYGLTDLELEKFDTAFNKYVIYHNNDGFYTLYKIIMDMIALKHQKVPLSKEDIKRYEDIFFAGRTVKVLEDYWNNTLYKINNKSDKMVAKIYLQKKSINDLKTLKHYKLVREKEEEISKYNQKLEMGRIKAKIVKISNTPITPISSGNGFVDIIMILSFVATEVLVGAMAAITLIKG